MHIIWNLNIFFSFHFGSFWLRTWIHHESNGVAKFVVVVVVNIGDRIGRSVRSSMRRFLFQLFFSYFYLSFFSFDLLLAVVWNIFCSIVFHAIRLCFGRNDMNVRRNVVDILRCCPSPRKYIYYWTFVHARTTRFCGAAEVHTFFSWIHFTSFFCCFYSRPTTGLGHSEFCEGCQSHGGRNAFASSTATSILNKYI